MNPRICRCCGEPIHESGNALSRNPNVCASCSSMADGMEESNVLDSGELVRDQGLPAQATEKVPSAGPQDKELEPATHLVSAAA